MYHSIFEDTLPLILYASDLKRTSDFYEDSMIKCSNTLSYVQNTISPSPGPSSCASSSSSESESSKSLLMASLSAGAAVGWGGCGREGCWERGAKVGGEGESDPEDEGPSTCGIFVFCNQNSFRNATLFQRGWTYWGWRLRLRIRQHGRLRCGGAPRDLGSR